MEELIFPALQMPLHPPGQNELMGVARIMQRMVESRLSVWRDLLGQSGLKAPCLSTLEEEPRDLGSVPPLDHIL